MSCIWRWSPSRKSRFFFVISSALGVIAVGGAIGDSTGPGGDLTGAVISCARFCIFAVGAVTSPVAGEVGSLATGVGGSAGRVTSPVAGEVGSLATGVGGIDRLLEM